MAHCAETSARVGMHDAILQKAEFNNARRLTVLRRVPRSHVMKPSCRRQRAKQLTDKRHRKSERGNTMVPNATRRPQALERSRKSRAESYEACKQPVMNETRCRTNNPSYETQQKASHRFADRMDSLCDGHASNSQCWLTRDAAGIPTRIGWIVTHHSGKECHLPLRRSAAGNPAQNLSSQDEHTLSSVEQLRL